MERFSFSGIKSCYNIDYDSPNCFKEPLFSVTASIIINEGDHGPFAMRAKLLKYPSQIGQTFSSNPTRVNNFAKSREGDDEFR